MKTQQLKRMLKTVFCLSLSMILAFSATTTAFALSPAETEGNPADGENGHMTMNWYVTPTDIADVYKVDLGITCKVYPKPAEVVLVLDNSGSMGYPYDLSPGVWQGVTPAMGNVPDTAWQDMTLSQVSPSGPAYDGNPTTIPTGFTQNYGHPDGALPPYGSYEHGADAWDFPAIRAFKIFPGPEHTSNEYRLEWVRDAAMEALDDIFSPTKNQLNYDVIKVAIVAYGGAYTEVAPGRSGNSLTGSYGYPAILQGVVGGGPNDFLGGGAGNATLNDCITYTSAWMDSTNYTTIKNDFFEKYIRRAEDTYVAAGLEKTMELFDGLNYAPENRHVFLLADGGDTTAVDFTNPISSPGYFNQIPDPTKTLAAAAKLKSPDPVDGYGAKIFAVGVLPNSYHNSNPDKSYITSDSVGPKAYPETHLMRIAAPLKPIAKQYDLSGSGYFGNKIGTYGIDWALPLDHDSDSMMLDQGSFPIALPFHGTGDGYKEYVDDIIANFDASTNFDTFYQFANTDDTPTNTKAQIKKAFKEFVDKFQSAASDIEIQQQINPAFQIYQMPGKPLVHATLGTTSFSGNLLNWGITALPVKGGSETATFYVKFDRTNADPNLYYPIADFTNIRWSALGTVPASSQFPIPYISGAGHSGKGDGAASGGVLHEANATGTITIGGKNTSKNTVAGTPTSNVIIGSITGSKTTTTSGSGTTTTVNDGGFAPPIQPYKASTIPAEEIDQAQSDAAKGKKITIKVSKALILAEATPDSKTLIYTTKGKTYQVNAATKNYYQVSFKTKSGETKIGYIAKKFTTIKK